MSRVHLIHCSFHKCLTVYYRRIMDSVFNRCLPWSSGYHHYNSHLEDFYAGLADWRIASINNRMLDLDRLGDYRISRFVRDPRDLVVSGYFYHRRGAEPWTTIENPTDDDWYFANGVIPEGLRASGGSFAGYLSSLSEEEGLLAELEFRTRHFEAMTRWPVDDPHISTHRYEEILGREVEVIGQIVAFYGLSAIERRLCTWFANRYTLSRRRADPHIRNPSSGQWRRHFTPRVKEVFDDRFGGLIHRLGYPAE